MTWTGRQFGNCPTAIQHHVWLLSVDVERVTHRLKEDVKKESFSPPLGGGRTQVDAPSDRVQLSANLGNLQRVCADDLSVVYFVITDKFLNAAPFRDQ